jgi:hypothetical protein
VRRILSSITLLLAFLLCFAGTASAAYVDTASKDRVGVSERIPIILTYYVGSLELEPQRGDTIIGYDPATGVVFYVRQNPWTKFDPLGLNERYAMGGGGSWVSNRSSHSPGMGQLLAPTTMGLGRNRSAWTGSRSGDINHYNTSTKPMLQTTAGAVIGYSGTMSVLSAPGGAALLANEVRDEAVDGAAGALGLPAPVTSLKDVGELASGVAKNSEKLVESAFEIKEKMVKLFHKGKLDDGNVDPRRKLSLGTEKESVEALDRPGEVHEFEVPQRKLNEMEDNNQLEYRKDYDATTGVQNEEVRIYPPASGELNDYKIEVKKTEYP